MRRLRLTVILLALGLVATGAVAGYVIAESGGAAAVRTPLAQSTKVKGVKGRTLGLSRVTMSGPADKASVVRKISGGQTGKIRAGQWIVEQPSTIHQAANNGSAKVVIYLSTLLRQARRPRRRTAERPF